MKWKYVLDVLVKSDSKEIVIHQLEKVLNMIKDDKKSFSSYKPEVSADKLIFETEYELRENDV